MENKSMEQLDVIKNNYYNTGINSLLNKIPQQKQRQDSTDNQLKDLHAFANKLGMYDAADLIKEIAKDI